MEAMSMMEIMTSHTLPPGIGFHPTDEELIYYYLKRKIIGVKEELEIIQELDIYKHEPWDLPGKSVVPSRDCKWHFFTCQDRKYPNGGRRNRATEAGYWKATGKDRNVSYKCRIIGTRKTLVFHKGRAPTGDRTDWVMHEYHIKRNECEAAPGMHDAFVLCRVTKKNGLASQDEDTIKAHAESSGCPLKDQTSIAATSVNYESDSVRMEELLEKTPSTSEIRDDEGLQKTPTGPSMISDGLIDGLQQSSVFGIIAGPAPPMNELNIESFTGYSEDFPFPKSYPVDPYASHNYQGFSELDFLHLPDDLLLSGLDFSALFGTLDTCNSHNTQITDMASEEHNLVEELYTIVTEASTSESNVGKALSLTAQGNMEENMRAWDSTNPKNSCSIDFNGAGFEIGENNEGDMRTWESTVSGCLFDSSETGIQRRIRSEKSQFGESSQERIRLQVNKMQSRSPRPAETCTFDQNVQIVTKALISDLDFDIQNINKQYSDGSDDVLVLEETSKEFSDPDKIRTGTGVKPKSEKSSKASHLLPHQTATTFEGPGQKRLVSLPESDEYSSQFCGDKEQVQGIFRRTFTLFQRCSSTGSSYLFSMGSLLGSASLMFYFPILKVLSWMSS